MRFLEGVLGDCSREVKMKLFVFTYFTVCDGGDAL